jgi:hypothetical protein
MLRPTEAKAEEARKKAHDLFQRDRAKDAEAVKEREKAFEVQSAKTAKLKALRLARDAAAAAVVVEKPVAVKKTKKAAKAV